MRVIAGLVLWSVAEISAFVVVGGWIGLIGVLALVLGTGVAGVVVLRRQGLALVVALQRPAGLQQAGQAGLLAVAGVMLILPGLLTDLAGLALMVPQVRRWIAGRIGVRGTGSVDVVEGTAVEVRPDALPQPSGWTKP